ncbi:uncharacterized protein LOC125227618 [Leguminivora glycinivorella]|uniref:uncharacterized protein LOC125227618 n=1 Tax=Leguminivora glycinivorella TaxID=1035111 RepID=UPI00200BBF7D|nr:uncharacterized protein LOC125227618 [Leguminivora glycinivorella]
MTKRELLSNIAQVFDPLGWLSPVTTKLKLLFQNVISNDIGWNDQIPQNIKKEWFTISQDLQVIKDIKIPRWLNTCKNQEIELHGYCDSSTKAYACAIYCRVISTDDKKATPPPPVLIAAKSRLVPSKKAVSLPRLELCSALLLSALMEKVKLSLSENQIKTVCWSDSTAVLGWLNGEPSKWKPFIANRVTKITKIIPPTCWNYVKSEENPADCASRGITAQQLLKHPLWWNGPNWLSSYSENQERPTFTTDQEVKISKQSHAVTCQQTDGDIINELICKHSNMTHCTRVLAWILRVASRRQQSSSYLTADELNTAKNRIIKYVQEREFSNEIINLKTNQSVHLKSNIVKLRPFLDQNGMLRVRGRLHNAHISWEMKHPLIIPHRGRLTELLIDQAHKATLHGTAKLTHSKLRESVWIIGGNRATKNRLRRCITCLKQKPPKQSQLMGDLPESRSSSSTKEVQKEDTLPSSVAPPAKQTKQRKTRSKLINYITMALMLFMLIISPAQCNHSVSHFKEGQGIYFDKITNMKLARDEWKLVVYYDINPYWEGSELFSKYIRHLENMCHALENKQQCNIVLTQLRHAFSELKYYDSMLLGQRVESPRQRRAFFNGVGNVAHSLFGVLDEQFAEQYQKDIDLTRANEKHLAQLWRNQTSVIEAEANLLKRVETSMQNQHKTFNQHINNIEKSLNKQATEMQESTHINEITVSSIIANNILVNLKSIQDTLLDTIANVIYGKFNVHLLTPQQLKDELNIIAGQMPKDLTLPCENINTDLPKLYQLMKVRTRMTRQYLIFEIKIPLVFQDVYELFRLISIPRQVGKNMIKIRPIAKQVAINIKKESYIPMLDETVNKCSHYDSYTLICTLQGPIYQLKSDSHLCIADQMSNECSADSDTCRNIWTELSTMNTYLYFCCDECTARIICGQEVKAEHLNKAGIITLRTECVLNGDAFTIFPQKKLSNEIKTQSNVVKFDVPSINNVINLTVPVLQGESTALENNDKYFKVIRDQIEHMKNEGALSDRINYHDIHHYTVIYVVMGIVAVLAALYVRRYIRRRQLVARLTPPFAAAAAAAPRESGRRPTSMSITSRSSIPSATEHHHNGQPPERQDHRVAATALNSTNISMFRGFTSIK